MNREQIRELFKFQEELIEYILDTDYGGYVSESGEVQHVVVDADIVAELYSRNARYIGHGAYSVAYETSDGMVLTVTQEWDKGKQLAHEFSHLAHMPYMDSIEWGGHFILYEMEMVTVLCYNEMTEEQQAILDVFNQYYDLDSLVEELDDDDTEANELPDSLKETLRTIAHYTQGLSLDTKDENIGWDAEGNVVLFDLFLE